MTPEAQFEAWMKTPAFAEDAVQRFVGFVRTGNVRAAVHFAWFLGSRGYREGYRAATESQIGAVRDRVDEEGRAMFGEFEDYMRSLADVRQSS